MSPLAVLLFATFGAPQHPPRVQEFAVELIDMPRIDDRAPIRRMGFWLRFRKGPRVGNVINFPIDRIVRS